MNPGSEWIVEFAVREKQTQEQRARERTRQAEGFACGHVAPGFGQRCLGGVGHLLVVAGAQLIRQAGEGVGGIEGERHWDTGAASWASRLGRDW